MSYRHCETCGKPAAQYISFCTDHAVDVDGKFWRDLYHTRVGYWEKRGAVLATALADVGEIVLKLSTDQPLTRAVAAIIRCAADGTDV